MKLTQRTADIAKKWITANLDELIAYKKSREKFEQLDLDTLENQIEFSSLWYCMVQYINPTHVHIIFGYRLPDKPSYFKKIVYEEYLSEDSVDYEHMKQSIDAFVDKVYLCNYCDNHNIADERFDNMCKHCYIFGTVYEDDDCAICLTKDYGVWLVTSCDHKFHYRCYNKMSEKVCPICRTITGNNTTLLDY